MNDCLTKIIATLGPVSVNDRIIGDMVRAGADMFRLNFSHGALEQHGNALRMIRQTAEQAGKPIGVFQDLQGPKIRIGQIRGGGLELIPGEELVLTVREMEGGEENGVKTVSVDYAALAGEARPGHRVLVDDGLIELKVEQVAGQNIRTRVVGGGVLKPRKGVNLPHVPLSVSAITEKDRRDLEFAFTNELEYVALSFVRRARDVTELLDLMNSGYGRKIPVIAKIEKPEALRDIDNIIDVSDAVMVARGDLGVETSPQEVPIFQKTIIRRCNLAGKPVITATQMLESMIANPRPTRAEAGDVANAILDGTDAVMLSGETAVGKYPVESVRMMKAIAQELESSELFALHGLHEQLAHPEYREKSREDLAEAVSYATIELAEKTGAKFIVTFTHSGGTARNVSKYRPVVPVIAFSPVAATVRRLSLVWGVTPVQLGMVKSVDELLDGAAEVMKFRGMVAEGDSIVITAGVPVGVPGSTNMIKVVRI